MCSSAQFAPTIGYGTEGIAGRLSLHLGRVDSSHGILVGTSKNGLSSPYAKATSFSSGSTCSSAQLAPTNGYETVPAGRLSLHRGRVVSSHGILVGTSKNGLSSPCANDGAPSLLGIQFAPAFGKGD